MKRPASAALTLFLLAGSPVLAQQQSESEAERVAGSTGATEHGSSTMFWGWINFALLAGGLGYVIKKNAGPYFAKRSLEIRKGMVEADEARAEAEAKVADVDRRLANLEAEIEALRHDARLEEEAEAQRAQRDAAAEMAKVQAQLADEVAAAGKAAALELRRYSAELALGLAEHKIATRMSPEIQGRIVKSFVTQLAQAGGQGIRQ
jgi:F-type H+-transporting ATPase subunit b